MNGEERSKVTPRARFNFLDAAIVLLALLTALALWQKNNLANIFENDRTKASYAVAFEIAFVRYDLIDDLAADTVLRAAIEEGTVELGVLQDEPTVTPRDATAVEGADLSKRYVDLTGTLLCQGVLRDGALVVSSELLLEVGMLLPVTTETSNLQIQVISITEIR